eukprot:11176013-Lingulodinium_polyedra.AAC.1
MENILSGTAPSKQVGGKAGAVLGITGCIGSAAILPLSASWGWPLDGLHRRPARSGPGLHTGLGGQSLVG